jgi:hypothetical protein
MTKKRQKQEDVARGTAFITDVGQNLLLCEFPGRARSFKVGWMQGRFLGSKGKVMATGLVEYKH